MQSIAPTRTVEAIDFADRLSLAAHDAWLIDLAVTAALENEDETRQAIVYALRRLGAELDELHDQVLPPMTEQQQAHLRACLKQVRP
jgi:hypothetical protein